MIIDASNGKIINSKKVYIHDDILEELCFFRTEKRLHLSILDEKSDCNSFSIDFLQVIGFEMTSCDFWGSSPYILDFEYVEKSNTTVIPQLFEIKKNDDDPCCPLNDREKYIETIITFKSGDRLRIACESIMI